jgi:hypothetical protein
MLRRAYDEHGVTFFDAADTYGNGRAERQLALAFKRRRGDVVIGTKVGYDIYNEAAQEARRGQSELPMRTDPAYIRFAVDQCLDRLDTDYIDVLQIHNVKMEQVRQPAMGHAARFLKKEGKIRAWGAAFGPAIGWLAKGGRGSWSAARHRHDPDDLEHSRAAPRHGDAFEAARPRAALLLQHSGDARVGHARGKYTRTRSSRLTTIGAPAAVVAPAGLKKIQTLDFLDAQ